MRTYDQVQEDEQFKHYLSELKKWDVSDYRKHHERKMRERKEFNKVLLRMFGILLALLWGSMIIEAISLSFIMRNLSSFD